MADPAVEAALLRVLVEHELVVNPKRIVDFSRSADPVEPRSWLARRFTPPPEPSYRAVDGVSMDSIWLFDLPDEVTHAVSAQARWDAAELASSLIDDRDWVLATSPDMDAPDFDAILEVAVRERILQLWGMAEPTA